MDPIIIIFSIISVILAAFTGLIGDLIHFKNEKFGKLIKLHMPMGTLSVVFAIILLILLLIS